MPVENTPDVKTELRRLVAGNRLRAAADKLTAATAGEAYGDYRSKVAHQMGLLNEYADQQIMATHDYATLARSRNQVSQGLLRLIDDLPDAAALSAAKLAPTGVSEAKLKKRVFWLLLLGKLMVLFYAWFQHDTGGGINDEGLLTVVGILIPMFGVYLAMTMQDATKNRRVLQPEDIRVTKDFARRVYLIICAYPLILCLLLYLRGVGAIPSMAALTVALGLAESGWGVYVSKVVIGLFKGE